MPFTQSDLDALDAARKPHSKCAPMKPAEQIPYYAPDGTSLGFRSMKAAKRLIAGGVVKPSYGRKGHLKAIWLRREDVKSARTAGTGSNGRCHRFREKRFIPIDYFVEGIPGQRQLPSRGAHLGTQGFIQEEALQCAGDRNLVAQLGLKAVNAIFD